MFVFKKLNFKKNLSNIISLNSFFFEQALTSFSNFILAILLLKFLGVETFGIFSFFWILLLLINAIQQSSIIAPMLSICPKINYLNQAEYLGGVFLQQIVFCLINWILFLIFSIFLFSIFFDFDISNLYLSFSFLLIVSQFFQFFRKLYIFKLFLKKLIFIDAIYLILLVSSLLYLNFFENLNLKNVFHALIFSNLF